MDIEHNMMDNIFKKSYRILLGDKKHLMLLICNISGCKWVEGVLQKSEEKYRTLIENASDAIFVINGKGQYLEVNKKACEMFGYTKEEFLSLEINNTVAPDQMDTVLGYFGELLEKEQKSCEFDVIRKNGERLSIELNAVSLGNDRYMGIMRDITERNNVEESLQLEMNVLISIFDAIGDGIYIVGQNHDIEYVNPVLINDFGPYKGQKCFEYFHDREEICPWCKNDEVFARKTMGGEWYSFKNKRTYDFMDMPLKNPDGSISKLEILRDITGHKKAEEALRESEEKYRSIVEINPDIIYQLDTNGIITFISHKINEIIGKKPDELIGKNISEIVHKDDLDKIKLINERRTGKRAVRRLELRLTGKKGIRHVETRYVGINATGVYENGYNGDGKIESRGEPKGKYNGTHGTITDITERKKIESYKNATHEIARILLEEKTNKTLDTVLEKLGKVSDSSRTYIFKLDHTKKIMSNTYEWVNPDELKSKKNPDGIEAQIENLQGLPMDTFSKFMAPLKKNEVINVSNIYEYDFDESFRNHLEEQGIKSILVVPLYYKEKLNGFIGFDECKKFRERDDATVEFLINNANGIASFLEREQTHKELKQQREEQQIILDSVPAMIFYKDKEDRFISVNKALAKAFKMSIKDIIGKKAYELFPTQEKVYWENDKQVMASGKPKRNIIEPFETPEGTRWHQTDKIPYKDKKGNTIGVIVFAVDITERKKLDEEFRQKTAQQEVLLSSIPAFVYYKDTELRLITANKAFAEMANTSINQLAGKTAYDLFPKEQAEAFHKDDIKVMESGKLLMNIEEQYTDAAGKKGWASTSKIPYFNEKGKVAGMVGITWDITERKYAEEEIKKAREQAETYLDIAGVMMASTDDKEKITMMNKKGHEILGYKEGELIGKNWIDTLVPESIKNEIKAVYNKLITCEEINTFEYYENPLLTKDGKERIIAFHNTVIKGTDNKITGILMSGEDITEHKRLETQFIQAQKMESVGKLAGGIAHDFNNILTVILGNAHLTLMSLTKEDPIIDNILEIKNSADRATDLIRQLLAFSRRQIIEPQVIILNNTILEMDRMFRRLIGEDIELVTIPTEDLWHVKIDPGQIEQVLTNLVVNARDAMSKGGNLTIETANVTLDEEYTQTHTGTKPGDYVMMAVSDTGVGMDEETVSHIFEPFFTTKEQGKGTGLGLSICYGIIKQNGGNIWVYSEQRHGTSFKIYLPREFGETTNSIIRNNNSPKGTETILVVEDKPKVRQMTLNILRDKGYTVYEAANGEEALRVAEKDLSWNIHLLITDVVMPCMSGKELSEHFKIKNPDIKVLFVSGYTDNSIVQHGVLEPGLAFLQKPFSLTALIWKVRQILDE